MCECICRHTIRCLLRGFTQEELSRDIGEGISLKEAKEIMEGITLDWNNQEFNFELYLRKNINGRASEMLSALKTCTCCDRHQTNRNHIEWTLFENDKCECICRNTIRFIKRAFTQEELRKTDENQMTLREAKDIIEEVSCGWKGGEENFALYLRNNIKGKAPEILSALETCICCLRHQTNRDIVRWTLFDDN